MNILYTTDSNRHNILIPIEEIVTRDNTGTVMDITNSKIYEELRKRYTRPYTIKNLVLVNYLIEYDIDVYIARYNREVYLKLSLDSFDTLPVIESLTDSEIIIEYGALPLHSSKDYQYITNIISVDNPRNRYGYIDGMNTIGCNIIASSNSESSISFYVDSTTFDSIAELLTDLRLSYHRHNFFYVIKVGISDFLYFNNLLQLHDPVITGYEIFISSRSEEIKNIPCNAHETVL